MLVNVYKIVPGNILEKDVYRHSNTTSPMITAGTILSEYDIFKLQSIGIDKVHVKTKTMIEENSTLELYDEVKKAYDNSDYSKLVELSRSVASKIIANPYPVINLNSYFEADSIDFIHNYNICLMSTFIATVYNKDKSYQNEKLPVENVCLASLLQSVGRRCLNKEYLSSLNHININKNMFPNYSSDYLYEYNPLYDNLYTYNILNQEISIPTIVKNSFLYMRENEYGTGLLNVSKNVMNDSNRKDVLISKIVSVAKQYDFLLNYLIKTNRSLLNVPIVLDSAKKINNLSDEMTQLFLNSIPLFAVGTRILLSNGDIGIVKKIDLNNIDKPIVELENTKEEINLTKCDLYIDKIIELELINANELEEKKRIGR